MARGKNKKKRESQELQSDQDQEDDQASQDDGPKYSRSRASFERAYRSPEKQQLLKFFMENENLTLNQIIKLYKCQRRAAFRKKFRKAVNNELKNPGFIQANKEDLKEDLIDSCVNWTTSDDESTAGDDEADNLTDREMDVDESTDGAAMNESVNDDGPLGKAGRSGVCRSSPKSHSQQGKEKQNAPTPKFRVVSGKNPYSETPTPTPVAKQRTGQNAALEAVDSPIQRSTGMDDGASMAADPSPKTTSGRTVPLGTLQAGPKHTGAIKKTTDQSAKAKAEAPSTATKTNAAPAAATTAATGTKKKTAAASQAAAALDEKRAPQIIVKSEVDKDLATKMKKLDKNIQMVRKRKSTIVTPSSVKAHGKLMKMIKEDAVKAFTYSTTVNTTTFRILKGVHNSYIPMEIQEDIEELTQVKCEVFQMKMNNGGTIRVLDMFRVKFDTPQEATKVGQVQYVLNQKVRWEIPNKTDIIQCYSCQNFGHVSANCTLDPRCVKCQKSHKRDECELDKPENASMKAFCVNCGEVGHPASFKGCPDRKRRIELMMRRREAAKIVAIERAKAQTNFTAFTAHGVTFADAVKNQMNKQRQQEQPEQLINRQQNLGFDLNFTQLGVPAGIVFMEMKNYVAQFRALTSEEEKTLFIIRFMFEVLAKHSN